MEAQAKQQDVPQGGKRTAFAVLALIFVAAGAVGVHAWLDGRQRESTDDAFIDGHISQVAAQIAGRVTGILVQDNELVRAGQVLLRIDPRETTAHLAAVQAQAAQARAQLAVAQASVNARQADLAQAEAQVQAAEADQTQARQDAARLRAINPRAITRQQFDQAEAALQGATARLAASRHAVASMRAQLAVAAAQVELARAQAQESEANLATAKLQQSYTDVVAPAPGRVTKRTVELGNYVTPGEALLAIVQPGLWVSANFKETQLTDMRPGQRVSVRVDAFPDHVLSAHVDSLQAGTGSVFAALPAENATGNYVKVVQRLPVKIVFDDAAADDLPLAPGMSVTPTVTVR